MMKFEGRDASKEFNELFGKDVSTLSARQIWWLVKFGKHIRGRCRSNAALTNYLKSVFPRHEFKETAKVSKFGKSYKALSIFSPTGETVDGDEDGEE